MAPSTSKPSRVVVSKNTRAASKKVNVAPTNARASSRPASIRQERRPSSRREESRPASRREQNRDFVIVELTSDNFPLEGKSADLVEWEPTVVELRDVEAKLKEHPECRQLLERYRTAKSSPTPVSLSMKADDLYARFENVLYEIDVLSFTAHGKVRLSWKMYPAAIAGVVDAQGPATAEEEIEELKKNLEEKEQENAILQERIDLMATENEKLEQKMKEMIEGQRMMLDQEAARYNDVEAWVRQAMAVERLNNRGAFIPELEEAVRAHQPDEVFQRVYERVSGLFQISIGQLRPAAGAMGEEVVLEAAAVPPILAAVQGAPNGEEENDLIIDVVQMGEPVDMPRPQMNLNQNGEEDDSDVEVIEEEED